MVGHANLAYIADRDDDAEKENCAKIISQGTNAERIEEPYKRQVWTKRYGNALKQMAPVRPSQKDDGHIMPGPSRGFLSLFSLHWLTPHMWKAFRGTLSTNDLWNLRSEDTCQANCDRLERHWQDEVARKGPKNASLSSVLLRTFRARIVFSCFFMVLGVIFQFVGPSILLASMMRYVNDASATYSQGLQLFVLIVLCQLARTYCCYGLSTVTATFATFRASGALQLMVYRKVIRLSSASDQILGKVVNICVSDMDRVFDAFTAGPLMFSAIAMFVFALVFSILIVGPWCLLGFILILLCYPLLGSMAAVSSHLRLKVVKCTDRRINLMSEILAAIRLIKTYAWEDSFKKTVFAVRAEEHAILQRVAFLQSTSSTISPIIGVLAAMSTILGYILSGNKLSPEAAFAAVAVFNAMQFSIGTLPYGIKMVTEVHVALRRIQRMLLLDDIAEPDIALSADSALQIEQGTFAWEKTFLEKKGKEEKGVKDKSSSKKSLPSVESNGSIVDCADISRNSSVGFVPGLTGDAAAEKAACNGDTAEKEGCNGVEKTDALDAENQTELVETLHDIDLSLARGRLIGVAGSVGAGKTSLLLAITGQLRKMSGRVRYSGSLAVASQTAWIFGGTLRDNILFGSKLDEDKYGRALDVCALRSDLRLLEHGDNTEIGERGVNLSGGQKQRVSLARAVYAEADIYLLDDPLSAVDARVGKHIFEQCILGELADRTVLLVSHGVQYLSRCDEILMMKEGRLVERGTHAELISRRGEYFKLISYDTSVESEAHHVNEESSRHSKSADGDRVGESRDSGLAEEHQLKKGFFRLLLAYCRACGGCAMLLVLTLVVMFGVGRSANAIYLQYWLDQGDGLQEERLKNITNSNITYTKSEITGFINDNADLTQHVVIYCMISVIFILLGLVKGLGVALRVIKGATKVHDDMFEGLMRCKMSFFDQNPAGRILNRFSRDMDELDNKIPMLLEFLLQGAFIILVQFIVPVAAFPPITILLVFVSFVYSLLARGLVASIRETKHVENLVRSPVIHHITSTVSGLPIIRAFKRQHIFSKRFEDLLNRHTSANMEFRMASVWYSMRVEEVSNIVMSVVTLFLVFYRSISPAAAGLVLTSVYGWITFLSFWMRMITELGARLTSVERCEQYINSLEYEAAAYVPDGPAADGSQWPSAGAVELRSVCLRYRPELPRVLHDVSVKIRAGEKVGVVGRTGAGKSTLISTLLRMVELEQGQVLLDGVDVAKVGLHQLRSSIDVIPQDPILFSGTVRYNLDPFGQYEDDRLWDVLEKANLKRKISRAKKQLEMKVSSDGDNFSVGEKQLMCLARALLRRNKILLLDEATASVDIETDHLIQSTIRRNFELCTVLTIAHRLNTVVSYDRVLVMDAGRVCEFDSPLALMASEGSLFRQMMSDSGVHTDDQLKQLQNNQLNRAVL